MSDLGSGSRHSEPPCRLTANDPKLSLALRLSKDRTHSESHSSIFNLVWAEMCPPSEKAAGVEGVFTREPGSYLVGVRVAGEGSVAVGARAALLGRHFLQADLLE